MAAILAEAALGSDGQTAKRHGICRKTLCNWRKRLGTDEEFASEFSRKKALLEVNWGDEAVKALGRMIRKLDDLVQQAGPEKIHEVAGAVKIVGELEVVRGMVSSGKQSGASRQDPASAALTPIERPADSGERPGAPDLH